MCIKRRNKNGEISDFIGMTSRGAERETAAKIDELMNFSHEARWLWVALKAFGSRYVASSVKFYCPLKVYGRQRSSGSKFYDFSSFSLLVKKSVMNWWWQKLYMKYASILVGGRAGKKLPTKVRAKQPKASKKVKFISEYWCWLFSGVDCILLLPRSEIVRGKVSIF